MSDRLELPDTIEEILEKYNFVEPSESILNRTSNTFLTKKI